MMSKVGRIQSIDMARGLAVILVVTMHSTLVVQATPEIAKLNSVLGGVRMPLLMLVSGFLVVPSLNSGRSLIPRIATLGWLFGCWSLLNMMALSVINGNVPSLSEYLWEFIAPTTPLWFVWALGLMTLALAVTPRSKHYLLTLTAFAVSMLSHAHVLQFELYTYDHAVENGIFFFIGATFPAILSSLLKLGPFRSIAIALPLLTLIRLADSVAVADIGWQLLAIPERLVACIAALQICALCTNLRLVARTLTWFGRNTLPVFVAHPIVIASVVSLWRLDTMDVLAATLCLTALAISGSMAIHAVLMSSHAGWLYRLPSSLFRIVEGEWIAKVSVFRIVGTRKPVVREPLFDADPEQQNLIRL